MLEETQPKPMQLDKFKARRFTSKERKHKKNGLCFYCGDHDHMVFKFPKKKNQFVFNTSTITITHQKDHHQSRKGNTVVISIMPLILYLEILHILSSFIMDIHHHCV
ncbi:hypothetical protein KP509_33G055500 [Ceratopteris richardii]|uniref:Uncharacterized protein n=1 Tax=Ceratopteris richardii TaxID=49495 RepID=A0A8T2QQ96_CERRI|nr:hypothetical protein KP509_33G055500 [Ceratopteris richardii]